MVTSEHYIDLYVNGERIEVSSEDGLGLSIDSVLFDPTEAVTHSAEYSYSFEIPSTPSNDKVFNYGNNLSRNNKFHSRYSAQVYADGELIFDGSLTVQGYDGSSRTYECNLVNVKINTVEEMFSGDTLTDIPWSVPFSGAETINSVNADASKDYFFPMVCYGAFQKVPYNSDEVANDYTSRFVIDKYNRWWNESFFPSLSVTGLLRRAFEWKGYTVGGDAFEDKALTNVYASTNLADGQSPDYNVGSDLFGKVSVTAHFDNTRSPQSSVTTQELKFPYFRVSTDPSGLDVTQSTEYNFSNINWWNLLDTSVSTVTLNEKTYMYDPGESVIVIPASGWYKVSLKAKVILKDPTTNILATQYYCSHKGPNSEMEEKQMVIPKDILYNTPIEVQLIRNYDDNIELIKGQNNLIIKTGDPNEQTYRYSYAYIEDGQLKISTEEYDNYSYWRTEFPHENLYGSVNPTDEDLGANNQPKRGVGTAPTGQTGTSVQYYGYMTNVGEVMPYDPAVSEGFICGLSSMGGGVMSIVKDGYSWSRESTFENRVLADVHGLSLFPMSGAPSATTYCENTLEGSPQNRITTFDNAEGRGYSGEVYCMIWLEKNDVLEPVCVQRDYDGVRYRSSVDLDLTVEAFGNETEYTMRSEGKGWDSAKDFPTELNLTNFTNSGTSVSDWVNNVCDAFNLEIVTYQDYVEINKNKSIGNGVSYAVELDDRYDPSLATSEYIDYPRTMSVKYQVDTSEWGFDQSVDPAYDESADWEDHGDSGYTVINLSDDTYNTDNADVQTNFSYTWYQDFEYKYVDSGGSESSTSKTVTMPVIAQTDYMADSSYTYDEDMQHDGYGLRQRFWFRQSPSTDSVWLADSNHEQVYLSYPVNSMDGLNLSYKDTERSLLTEYFDVNPMLASNYVEAEVYLTPREYKALKGGALAHFDEDLYYVCEIEDYDPSGKDPCTLRMVKKVD